MKKKILLLSSIGMCLILVSGYAIKRNLDDENLQFYIKKFELLTSLRRSALETYISTVKSEMKFWSVSGEIEGAIIDLQEGWLEIDGDPAETLRRRFIEHNPYSLGQRHRLTHAGDDSLYGDAHEEMQELGVELVTKRGYYDLFLIDPFGNIIYTVEKESDFATNIAYGIYAESGLGDVYRKAAQDPSDTTHVADFKGYAPSNGDAAFFLGHRITDSDGIFIGVVAAQLSIDPIIDIMQFGGGLGETGETYLVGEDGLLRSKRRFSDITTILTERVPEHLSKAAFTDKLSSFLGKNLRDTDSLTAFNTLDIGEIKWAIFAEISLEEIHSNSPVSNLALILSSLLSGLLGLLGTIFGLSVRSDSEPVSMDLLDDFEQSNLS